LNTSSMPKSVKGSITCVTKRAINFHRLAGKMDRLNYWMENLQHSCYLLKEMPQGDTRVNLLIW